MTRPKGSLNKKGTKPKTKRVRKTKPNPKPKKEKDNRLTLIDLKNIARERRIKLKCNSKCSDIRISLGMEPEEIPKRYDHCKDRKPAQTIIKTNVNTGEETKYKSIFELASSLKLFAGSITYRIKLAKSLLVDGETYTFRKEKTL